MNWVVIENTFVIVSIPLPLRLLNFCTKYFPRGLSSPHRHLVFPPKSLLQDHQSLTFHPQIAASIPLLRPLFNIAKASAMTHYGGSSYEMNSRTHGSKAFASVHTQSKSIALQSSSEENILPVQGTTRSVTNIASNHPKVDRESRDVEKGNAAGITRETTIQVLYEEGNGRGTPAGSKWGLAK